jgi:hypothetical protein
MDSRSPNARILLAALGLLCSAALFGGCQQQKNLFSDDDISTRNRLRYFGNESAHATTESRKQTAQFGFGFPSGQE